MNYTKLFNSIVTSTIWSEDNPTRIVWVTMLALADKNGEVHASIPGLARIAGVTIKETEAAIEKFLGPDPYSRTPDDEGRRIAPIEGGWELVNHAKYRALASKEDAKEKHAERQKRYRDRIANRDARVTQRDASVTPRDENDGQNDATVTQTVDIADTDTEAEGTSAVCEQVKFLESSDPSFPMSETYDVPTPGSLPPEGRKEGSQGFEEGGEEKVSVPFTESVFLNIARKLNVPENFAARVYLDLSAMGWKSANGSRVVSPASYLRDLWTRAKAKEARSGDGGAREPWQIDADIKRLKEEIRRIDADPASRNPAGPTWDEHREQFEGEWLALVQRLHDEARRKLPGEFRRFEAALLEAEKEARKGGTYDADPETARVFRLVQFAEAFPEDCPDFARWDKEWNRGRTWTDPKALNPAARAEIKLIRSRLKVLEEERRRALVSK